MQRTEWNFPYTADVLLEAAKRKIAHHKSRLAFWERKKGETMGKIKESGIEIDESLAEDDFKLSNSYRRGPTVQINNELLRDLEECVTKIKEHKSKTEGYLAWAEVLGSQGKASFPLNQDDWLYFFSYGHTPSTES